MVSRIADISSTIESVVRFNSLWRAVSLASTALVSLRNWTKSGEVISPVLVKKPRCLFLMGVKLTDLRGQCADVDGEGFDHTFESHAAILGLGGGDGYLLSASRARCSRPLRRLGS